MDLKIGAVMDEASMLVGEVNDPLFSLGVDPLDVTGGSRDRCCDG